ncbi:internal alternative NAD(P)H-ubiquinone oxidoreductase, mitochondrial-like [Raphidocelis subcapitata]|uniref:NADH:ubiquinone reductase (non-electrogenic) n=1 Tax=Raphidocelis subcapitata TaxID=307507 RepID=A0A2V0NY98_9CHLO|nr:internal alternative NAD(P)H-ubiquinone oxidoreductase, mitochondrial-like [Raphidocelis subcapitata]|eukprot:GBF90543.1 internal alternative NAD(P)H-ubiquinone oxidoreductase, mitochondrial-like [Raphidocelis subcapitata]
MLLPVGLSWLGHGAQAALAPLAAAAGRALQQQQQHAGAAAAAPRAPRLPPFAAGGPLRHVHAEKTVYEANSIPLRTGRQRLLILGTGWAAARLARDIDPKLYDLTVLSPRNHMVFTPLLASATTGTIEARSVAVHITSIQKALHEPQNQYIAARALAVYPERRVVEAASEDGIRFFVPFDKLAVCTGSQGSTFGIPGVEEHTHFLRDLRHAEAIRNHLIENIAAAGVPGRPMDEFNRLLHIVIVGGGPTGVEVAGELANLIHRDLSKIYPDRAKAMRVTMIEAKELLGSFDGSLREYAARKLTRQGIRLRKGVVRVVEPTSLTLTDGTVIPFGLCIWSTGVGPTEFTLGLPFAKTQVGRLAVDEQLRVLAPPKQDAAGGSVRAEGEAVAGPGKVTPLTDEHRPITPAPGSAAADAAALARLHPVPDVFALGDCCANPQTPLPALAQVAEQQGRYLARVLNGQARDSAYKAPGFVYKHLGSMATVGGTSAILQFGSASGRPRFSLAGFGSWVAWRSAYLTRLGSMRNRMMVAFDWTITMLLGRDVSRW